MSDAEDNKPAEEANAPITVRVKDQTGEETMFKIKKSTKMSKVFTAYAQRKGVEAASLRFLLDGERIGPDETPKMLELEDEDQIDCVLAQVGGADDDDAEGGGESKPSGEGGSEPITIRVKDQNGEETMFKIKRTTRMKKVFSTYAARKGVEATAMRFMLDGENIDPESTPAALDLDDNDQIDCFLAQVGGSF
ncbi:hypothetical protein ACHAXT_003340 [Thalassiosira profunda]